MFIKTKRKPLKYTILSRVVGFEWKTSTVLTSYNAAYKYVIETLDSGLDCAMVVTRGGQFEYEQQYYSGNKKIA